MKVYKQMLLNGGEDRTAVINLREEVKEIGEFLKNIETYLKTLYIKQQPFRGNKYSLDEYFGTLDRYNQVNTIDEYYWWEEIFPFWCTEKDVEEIRDNKVEFIMLTVDVFEKLMQNNTVFPFIKKIQLITIFSKPHINKIYKENKEKIVKKVAPNAVIE